MPTIVIPAGRRAAAMVRLSQIDEHCEVKV